MIHAKLRHIIESNSSEEGVSSCSSVAGGEIHDSGVPGSFSWLRSEGETSLDALHCVGCERSTGTGGSGSWSTETGGSGSRSTGTGGSGSRPTGTGRSGRDGRWCRMKWWRFSKNIVGID